ncbi:MAG: HAD family hydrolase [Anaerolineae bacterium]|jgi:putative hydrolase of the HAD superfamily
MTNTILFDLGNTLVRYFTKAEFPGILQEAITNVRDHLRAEGKLTIAPETIWQRVEEQDYEADDHRVRPLEQRLIRIFGLDPNPSPSEMRSMCQEFLQPLLARAYRYEDSLPVLQALKGRGYKTAIVSNLPWGSPSGPWYEEIARLGLAEWMDAVIFCSDVGWRKPAPQIFAYTLEKVAARPQDCIFVGDNPRWDVAGPRAMGIEAVLVDRHGLVAGSGERPRHTLEFLKDLQPW